MIGQQSCAAEATPFAIGATARRSVALGLEDGSLVTLQEGEAAGGLVVARILPDRVEVTRGGRVYTIHARD